VGKTTYGGDEDWMVLIASHRCVTREKGGCEREGSYTPGDGESKALAAGLVGERGLVRDCGSLQVVRLSSAP
jgi:hypothetical protein